MDADEFDPMEGPDDSNEIDDDDGPRNGNGKINVMQI